MDRPVYGWADHRVAIKSDRPVDAVITHRGLAKYNGRGWLGNVKDAEARARRHIGKNPTGRSLHLYPDSIAKVCGRQQSRDNRICQIKYLKTGIITCHISQPTQDRYPLR